MNGKMENNPSQNNTGPKFWEDMNEDERQADNLIRREKVEKIKKLREENAFPLEGETTWGEKVKILGLVDDIEPYKTERLNSDFPFSYTDFVVERDGGQRFLTFASSLLVDNEPLMPRPIKNREPSEFEKLLNKSHESENEATQSTE